MADNNKTRRPHKAADENLEKETAYEFPLVKTNFLLMAIAAAVIVVGFLLMLGGSSTPGNFNADIFSARRVVVGPTIAFLGFLFMGFAIIYRPKNQAEEK